MNKDHDKEKLIKVPRFNVGAGFYATKKSSDIMKKIKDKDTKAEIKLRKALWSLGYRYRLNCKAISGKPDIIFISRRVVIFVDGDFWHGYNWNIKKLKLQSNKQYWIPKIERNMQRDVEVNLKLTSEGWTVLRFWEHDVENEIENCIEKIEYIINKK